MIRAVACWKREEIGRLRGGNRVLEDQLIRCLGAQRVDNIARR